MHAYCRKLNHNTAYRETSFSHSGSLGLVTRIRQDPQRKQNLHHKLMIRACYTSVTFNFHHIYSPDKIWYWFYRSTNLKNRRRSLVSDTAIAGCDELLEGVPPGKDKVATRYDITSKWHQYVSGNRTFG
eukprot:1185658-Prorocentrum_minimum.AAC.5